MGLKEYRRKRDFGRTPEPSGGPRGQGREWRYAMQKHAARQLHYDLRLELDGVLLSWAIPQGPSLDPGCKRLAVHTEDHPLDYAAFEGIIPAGEYGGGTVLLWDQGTWEPHGDPQRGHAAGKLAFTLHGTKLRGGWTLLRMSGAAGEGGRNWLLVKKADDQARRESAFSITDEQPFSVLSGRRMQDIARDADQVWTSGGGGRGGARAAGARRPTGSVDSIQVARLQGARRAVPPRVFKLQRPVSASAVPSGDEWLHEMRLDGVRLICRIGPGGVRLQDGAGCDWTARLPEIVQAAAGLPLEQAILDGVAVVPDARGLPDRVALQEALDSGRTRTVVYDVFDLPYCQGHDLRQVPLLSRKTLLGDLLGAARPLSIVRFCDHIVGDGPTVGGHARRLGGGGLVSKKVDAPYVGRRTRSWLQVDWATPIGPEPIATQPGEHRRTVVVQPGVFVHGVRLTHPERILYPEERITKHRLVLYYQQIAGHILPHIVRRPLSLYRCPAGWEKPGFFHKHLADISDPNLRGVLIRHKTESKANIVIDDVAGLITLAQWNVLEIHPWGCREDLIERPDRLLFDLDPGPDVPWEQVVAIARALHQLLDELRLRSYLKTSGGKGLHLVIPLVRRCDWEVLKDFARAVAGAVVRQAPRWAVATQTRSARHGKVFIDFFRNHRGSTCVAPYSTRARSGAPVSTPVSWDELGPEPLRYTVESLPRRLATLPGDPWADFFECRQSITQAMRARLKPG